MTPNFPDELILKDAGMRGSSRLLRLVYYFRYMSPLGCVTVPMGFVTDGASIPRMFWSIMGPHGPWFYAAIIHDYLYAKASDGRFDCSRAEADEIFLAAMKDLGVRWHQRTIIYRAVRLFGWRSYKKFRHS
jgi:hypothetical protein